MRTTKILRSCSVAAFALLVAFVLGSCRNGGTSSPMPVSPPASPTGLSAASKAQTITLQWSAVDAATSYNIYYSSISNGAKITEVKISNVTSPYKHTHLNAGSYYYVVTAVNEAGESSKSESTLADVSLVTFVTSTSGNGNLGSWAEADGKTGTAAADAICQSRASAAGLSGTFAAWISDSSDDAYCRVQNLHGKLGSNCGQSTLPVAAGPWVRTDGHPYGGIISDLALKGNIYTPARYDEYGTLFSDPPFYFTNTASWGYADGASCGDWTAVSSGEYGSVGYNDSTEGTIALAPCDTENRLLCMQTGSGPQLSNFAASGKKVFVSSSTGTGDLGSWADAGGNTGIAAGDAICQSLAAKAGLANAAHFKAWLSDDTTNAIDHITGNGSNGPWVRLDGIRIAVDKEDLADGSLLTSIDISETGRHGRGSWWPWTGTSAAGTKGTFTCNNWSDGTAAHSGWVGREAEAGWLWTEDIYGATCDTIAPIYCFED